MKLPNAARAALMTALWTFLGTFGLTAFSWLQQVAEWASTSGHHPLPGLSVLGYAAVSAVVAAVSGLLNYAFRALQTAGVLPGQPPTYASNLTVDQLDQLGLLAYHDVQGVKVVVGDGNDPVGPHGINQPGETD